MQSDAWKTCRCLKSKLTERCLEEFQNGAGYTEVVDNHRFYHEGLIAKEILTIKQKEALGKDTFYSRRLKVSISNKW